MQVKIINRSRNPLPNYETSGSAGMDLRANIDIPIELQPMERMLIPTGLYIELQPGTTIDSDYRGEIKIPIINLSQELQTIDPAERIAQMVIARYETVTLVEVDDISPSDRGDRGFGSTGHL